MVCYSWHELCRQSIQTSYRTITHKSLLILKRLPLFSIRFNNDFSTLVLQKTPEKKRFITMHEYKFSIQLFISIIVQHKVFVESVVIQMTREICKTFYSETCQYIMGSCSKTISK